MIQFAFPVTSSCRLYDWIQTGKSTVYYREINIYPGFNQLRTYHTDWFIVLNLENTLLRGLMGKGAAALREILSVSDGSDLFSPECMAQYFSLFYSNCNTFDKANIKIPAYTPTVPCLHNCSKSHFLMDTLYCCSLRNNQNSGPIRFSSSSKVAPSP